MLPRSLQGKKEAQSGGVEGGGGGQAASWHTRVILEIHQWLDGESLYTQTLAVLRFLGIFLGGESRISPEVGESSGRELPETEAAGDSLF